MARSAAITVRGARVELDLAGAPESARTGFPTTTTTLEIEATVDTTWLDFIGQDVRRVMVNGIEQKIRYDGARTTLTNLGSSNVARIEAIGTYSRSAHHRRVVPFQRIHETRRRRAHKK